MPQANSNRMGLYRSPNEATWGTLLTTPILQEMRLTGESLAHQKNTVQSAEIRADGQVPDLIEVGASGGGNINIELSPTTYDFEIANCLKSTWTDKTGFTASITWTSGTKTLAGTNIGVNLVPGQYIRVTGAAQAGNNGFFTVATVPNANSITVVEAVTTEGPTASVKVDASRLRNGLTETSYTLERVWSDLSTLHFNKFPGAEVNTIQLTVQADQPVTGVLGIICKEELAPASATFGNGTPTAATTTDIFNATTNVGKVMEGSTLADLVTAIQSLNLSINTNRQGRRAIKSRGAVGLRQGRIIVTGTLTAYLEDGNLLAKMIAHTASALHIRFVSNPTTTHDGYALFITLPRLKYTAGDPNATAVDTDVLHPLGFQAIRDPITNCTIQFDRFPYPQP